MKVSSLIEFLQEVESINNDLINNNSILYFRGQSNKNWKPEPGIFRDNYLENEYKMFEEIINLKPEEFRKCENNLERLTLMQHYGLPTRLLDITNNPLVALYFATDTNINEDGKVFVYEEYQDIDYEKIVILSNFAKYRANSNIEELRKNIIKELGYEISFENMIKGINVEKIMVKAKLDNNRILKQSGAFYIFGNEFEDEYAEYLKESKLFDAKDEREKLIIKYFNKISKNKVKTMNYEEEKSIIVSKESKKEIRDFLSLIGINESTLFPELEYQAKHIKTKYQYLKTSENIIEDTEVEEFIEKEFLRFDSKKSKEDIKKNIIKSENLLKNKDRENIVNEIQNFIGNTNIYNELYKIFEENLLVDWKTRNSTLSSLKKELKRLFKKEGIDNKYVEEIVNILIEKY